MINVGGTDVLTKALFINHRIYFFSATTVSNLTQDPAGQPFCHILLQWGVKVSIPKIYPITVKSQLFKVISKKVSRFTAMSFPTTNSSLQVTRDKKFRAQLTCISSPTIGDRNQVHKIRHI